MVVIDIIILFYIFYYFIIIISINITINNVNIIFVLFWGNDFVIKFYFAKGENLIYYIWFLASNL